MSGMGSATQATRFKPVEMFLNDECVTTTDAPSDDGIESFESPAELKAFKASKENKVTFRTFFKKAKIHSNAKLIKGVVCGYRIEEIEDEFELYKQCRRMEKLIDELARGRKMEKVLRK